LPHQQKRKDLRDSAKEIILKADMVAKRMIKIMSFPFYLNYLPPKAYRTIACGNYIAAMSSTASGLMH
jgi:hypothetical protein